MIDAKLIDLLRSDGHTLVVSSQEIRCFNGRGVKDLLRLLREEPEMLHGANVADKVVGKAAAALMVLGRVNEVYAEKISVSAVALLAKHDIILQYSERVPYITNRDGTGLCPLEQACGSLSEPEDIFYAIQRTLEKMKLNSKTITDNK